jgi:hypothetical protein
MSYINVSSPTNRAILQISTATIESTSTGYIIAALQDITVSNSNGIFNWTQLDSTSQQAVATPATNQVSGNFVLDETLFFEGGNSVDGIFDLSNNKTLVYFRVYFNGMNELSRYVEGQGYLSNIAPAVNPTAPVWVSPIQISVDGDLTADQIPD